MSRPSRESLNLELLPSDVPGAVAFHFVRWGLLVALALLTFLVFPVAGGLGFELPSPNSISPVEVIAPFAFDVPKSDEELERERLQLEAQARPIYDYRADIVDSVLVRTDSLFRALEAAPDANATLLAAQAFDVRLTPEEAAYLSTPRRLTRLETATRQLLRDQLRLGVIGSGTAEEERHREIIVRRPNAERIARRDTVRTRQQVLDARERRHPDPDSPIGDPLYLKLLTGLFRPTLVLNTAAYEEAKRQLRESVNPVKYRVQEQQRIVDANDPVTPDAYEQLVAYQQELLERRGRGEADLVSTAAQIVANGLMLSVFWVLLMLYRPHTYRTFRHMLVLAVLFAIVILGAAAIRTWLTDRPELIPLPFAAMMITVLFRGRVAMVAAMVLAVLIASQAAYASTPALLIVLVGGVAAAVSVRTIRRRNQALTAAAVVLAAYLVAGLTVGLRFDWTWSDIGLTGALGGLNALASAALVSTLLPVFESLAQHTTELTLLELSDPSRPLLRQLATEAPGTYAHSVAVANLCEAACNAIGANGLLARVGSYYHDIGKLKKPQYFVENQSGGANPHDKLKPEASAAIIRNHVRDGLALADDHQVPAVVKAFIPEHHGTMEITYFLERARSRDSDPEIKLEDYRYPGPRPRSVETAAAMLADGVEAAVRVLDDPDPDRVRDAIAHIIKHRIEAGQLEEAPLTLAQLARIEEEFARVLGGTHHNRIDYPAAGGGIGADWEATASA